MKRGQVVQREVPKYFSLARVHCVPMLGKGAATVTFLPSLRAHRGGSRRHHPHRPPTLPQLKTLPKQSTTSGAALGKVAAPTKQK